jgi:eukaryotic-like serine/threonine-protein kinase
MPLAAGRRLGPYEVLSHLGEGGMGEVYRARDTRLDRTVALKVLAPAAVGDPRRLERFREEARAIARLSHPHICTLHDLGEQDGTLFLVMEHVQGRTLANRLEEGALPIDDVLRYGAQIADALHAAHAQGVVHRDLKPANVMLTREGVKLLDFGVARLRSPEEEEGADPPTVSHLTEEGEVLGTVPYMAPEQLEGRKVDARTDIFALGTTLYEMATGKRPFEATSRAGVIAAILASEPPPLSTVRPLVPPALDWTVRRCLAKDPDDRWQSARDVAAQLGWIREGGVAPGVAPEIDRSRGWWRAGMAAIAALVAGGAVGAVVAWRLAPGAPPPSPRFHRLTVRAGSLPSARFAADGQTIVYSASPQGGPPELFLARPGSPEARPLGLRPARLAALSSKDEIAYVRTPALFPTAFGTLSQAPLAGGGARDLMEGVRDADWSPEGSELAVSRRQGGLDVLEFPLGHRLHEAPAIWSLRVSRHGDRVAFMEAPFALTSRGDLFVADRAGRKTRLLQGEPAPLGLAWSVQDDEIWFGTPPSTEAGEISAVSLDGKRRTLARVPGAVSVLDVFSDGRALVAMLDVRGGLACRLGSADERELSWLDTNYVEDLSADGGLALVYEAFLGGGERGGVYVRPTDGSPAVRLGDGQPEALSPDGKWVLAHLREDGGDWMLMPTGAGTARKVEHPGIRTLVEADWLGDGRRIVLAGRDDKGISRLYLLDVQEGHLRPLTDEVSLPENAVTLDGRHFLGSVQGQWFLFSADGGERRAVPHLRPDDNPLQWTADGRFLFVRRGGPSGPVPVEVDRIEVATGLRIPWLKLAPRDPVGLLRVHPVRLLPDGGGYCYTYLRLRSDLYLVEGLR